MGKKVKVGKQRRDKAYWAAKEIGYRSRASFKLVQLNRKFEFLQKSRVCIDLCAAPGSWMQVAKEHMPMSSLIIGVDLAPIKPIPGTIAMVNDITTDKCRSDIKKELQTWKADVVLNDGAPNVGKNWIHDAYQQSLLTLSAFKLATEFLMKGGTFVTKIFRSKDYQSLIWVFNQFFKRVHSTKPAASRNESAEIFVVCLGYKAQDKIDPRFLDPKHVFSEITQDPEEADAEDREIVNPEKRKKAPADGYETGATVLYKQCKASIFIAEDKPIHILNNCNEIVLDEPRIYKHKKTTAEVKECCKDLRVLGMKELRLLKKWREALKAEFAEEEAKKAAEKKKKQEEAGENVEEAMEDESDKEENAELEALDNQIKQMKADEKKEAKRAKKKSLKEKRKAVEKINLNMVIPGDKGVVREEQGLFAMTDLKSKSDLETVGEQEPEMFAESDSDSEDGAEGEPKRKKVSREKGRLDKSGLFYKESDSEGERASEEESDSEDEEGLGFKPEEKVHRVKRSKKDTVERLNDEPENPLLLDLDSSSRDARKKKKSELWFDRDIFKGIEEEEDDLMEADVEAAIKDIEQKGGAVLKKKDDKAKKNQMKKKADEDSEESSDDEDVDGKEDSDSDSDFDVEEMKRKRNESKGVKEKEGFEVAPAETKSKKRKNIMLTPEELALGQEMIMSKKKKRDILNAGWNRYMFNDRDEDLPDWFVKEEQMHMRAYKELDPKVIAKYKEMAKDVNAKTIKKVVEAKARKKRKLTKKLDKAKKKAAHLLENPDLGNREKANEINKMYKKAVMTQKKEVTYVVAKKHTANKRAKRPANVKGFYKQVDPRMKKDTVGKRKVANDKRVKKRRLKGKKTQPGRLPQKQE